MKEELVKPLPIYEHTEIKNQFKEIKNLVIENKKVDVLIKPALVSTPEGIKAIFPNTREKLIERALRFLILEKSNYTFEQKDKTAASFVFTLGELKNKLSDLGNEMALNELIEAIEIMQGCDLEVKRVLNENVIETHAGPILGITNEIENAADKGKNVYMGCFHQIIAETMSEK